MSLVEVIQADVNAALQCGKARSWHLDYRTARQRRWLAGRCIRSGARGAQVSEPTLEVRGPAVAGSERVLTKDALEKWVAYARANNAVIFDVARRHRRGVARCGRDSAGDRAGNAVVLSGRNRGKIDYVNTALSDDATLLLIEYHGPQT